MHMRAFYHIISGLLFYGVFQLLYSFKIVVPFISKMQWSPFFLAAPVAGSCIGASLAVYAIFIKRVISIGFGRGLFPVTCYIPTLFASAYWASTAAAIRLLVPLVCMGLFIAHPVGASAWVYSMYWLIPVALYFVKRQNIVLTALGATFVQHAIGSIIWLYIVPTTPIYWISLMPVVLIERLLAISLLVGITIGSHILQKWSSKAYKLVVWSKRVA